jgi:GYD domain
LGLAVQRPCATPSNPVASSPTSTPDAREVSRRRRCLDVADDETATAAALKVSSLGNVRTTTMRAFEADEVEAIIEKAG